MHTHTRAHPPLRADERPRGLDDRGIVIQMIDEKMEPDLPRAPARFT